jgi:hypothetical protein
MKKNKEVIKGNFTSSHNTLLHIALILTDIILSTFRTCPEFNRKETGIAWALAVNVFFRCSTNTTFPLSLSIFVYDSPERRAHTIARALPSNRFDTLIFFTRYKYLYNLSTHFLSTIHRYHSITSHWFIKTR